MDHVTRIAIANLVFGVLQICLGWPLVKRKVPRNHFYGVRTPAALSSDERWYKINGYFGRQVLNWSTLVFLVALVGCFLPGAAATFYLAASLVGAVVVIAAPIILTLRWSSR